MNNFYSLGMDLNWEKDRAISAFSTILQDESLQLTVQADKRGNYFFIKDKESGNTYGQSCVDGYYFNNLEQVSDTVDYFHITCFFDDLDTRCDDNNIEFGDYDAAVGYLLTSDEFRKILRGITPDNWTHPIGVTAEINQADLIDFAERLLCKEILKTMDACALVEVQNMIFLSFYGVNDEITRLKKDPNWNFRDWWDNLTSKGQIRDFFMKHTSYAQLLSTLQPDVIEDFDDFNEMCSDFYLNKAAMCLMGLNWLICGAEQKCASQSAVKEPLTQADKEELYGQFIDLFEDFLEERNVCFADPEEKDTPERDAVITGDDYDELKQNIESLLVNWNLI